MSSYTSTQRFAKLTEYMLLEYEYTKTPSPEIYYVNTGSPSVGFEKIVNGYFNDQLQILNKPANQETTNNVRDFSVVQVEKNRFVSLDNDYLQPYLNTDPKLTPVVDLPITFPSNIGVYYDTVRFHIVTGYNFEDLDGVILQIRYPERNGKKSTVLQLLVSKGDITLPKLNPNPIYLGGALYDHYVEAKIPSYENMVYEFEMLNGNPYQSYSLGAKISSDGKGFLRNAPVEFTLYEVSQTVLKNGYNNYIAQVRSQYSVPSMDNYANLSAVITENSKYHYLEYYPTWNGNFLEDFINAEGYLGNSYFVINEVEVKEQVGLNFITTHNFSSNQTQDFNAPYIFRPILVNPLTTSFIVNYTLRLVSKKDQTQIIRRSSFTSFDVTRYGREINKINLTTGAYAQKVYNKIVQAPNLLKSGSSSDSVTLTTEKKIPVFYKDTNISVTQQSIIIDKDGNLTTEASSADSLNILGQGQAKILIDPFDNFYKFTLYTIKAGSTPEILDLGTSLSYYIVFLDTTGQSVKIENIKNKTAISNPTIGQIAFKIVESNSKKILSFSNREFYIISKTPDLLETKVYSGIWQNQTEFKSSQPTSSQKTSSGSSASQVSSPVTSNNTTAVSSISDIKETTQSSGININKGAQIVDNVPVSYNDTEVESKTPYSIGSSSVRSFTPTNVLEGKGDVYSEDPAERNRLNTEKIVKPEYGSTSVDLASLSNSLSGLESQNVSVDGVVKYYFTPGAPGSNLFKGLEKGIFLKAALQVHPKLSTGDFDPVYIQYCNSLNFPISEFPEKIDQGKKSKKY